MAYETPLFSVVVPVYNAEKYLDECVKSLVQQNEKNIEIILVNDGSTDSSGDICDKWAKIDERIVVVHKENGGVVSACKKGYEISKGRYFSKVDSDDWVSPDFFSNAVQCIRDSEPELIITDYISEPCSDIIKTKFEKNKLTDGMTLVKNHGKIHTSNDICYSCRMFFEIDFLQKNDLFFPDGMKTGEDTALNILAVAKAERVIALDYAGYHYRIDNADSAMRRKFKENLESDLQCQYNIRKSCFDNLTSYNYDMSVYYVTRIFQMVLNNCINSPEGLTYRNVKRILKADWLVDSYKRLGFDLPFESAKEKIMALMVKFRFALICYLYFRFKA